MREFMTPDNKARKFVDKGAFLDRLDAALALTVGRRTAVDCGAHVGTWTQALLDAGFEHVHAFEPNPSTIPCLQANITDPRAELHLVAVGDAPGRVAMFDVENSLGAHVGPGDQVDVVRLDDMGFRDVDFLKIDVEGYEALVLRGAEALIRKFRPIILMENKRHALRYGSDPDSVLQYAVGFGYRIVQRMKNDYILAPK